MGPRLRSRGSTRQAIVAVTDQALQWVRGCAAAVALDAGGSGPVGDRASMGPRLRSRGSALYPASARSRPKASMGPRLRSRGSARRERPQNGPARFNGSAAAQPR